MNCNNGNQAVQDHIGDAYDVVLAVYNLLDPISAVHANATNIQEILDNLGVISAVGGKMPAVLNISSNMDDLLDIHSLLPMLEIMNTNRQDYIDAGNLSGAIHKILSIRSQLNQISARITGGIFKGEKGDKGDTGDTGETGAIGLTGEAGSDGDNLSLMPSVANIGNLPLTDDVGTLRVVRNNSHIYKWTGTAPWLDLGLFANGQRGVSLVGRDRAIHLGDLPLAVDGAQDGDVRVVYEDGHQYTYHADSDSWTDMGQFLIQFKEWVADVDALPVGNNAHHDVRGTENDGKLYAWDDVDADWRYLGNLLGGLKMFNMQLPVATVADLPDPVEINTAFYVIKSGEIWVYEKVEYPVSGVVYGSGDVIPSVDEWVNKGLWQRGYKVADFNISDDGIVSHVV